ncbi:LysR substrate-binding domain-containing protein [Granulosicoccus sp.]|jgi:DNA-binding transcriptional LysR family regulator|nr:LysR substrate-binding domain-containing protein [Granulosicoccus sp.]MDB4223824.1 LysR substrate-binding domain-containing protein [Granulosicoccus sp.]
MTIKLRQLEVFSALMSAGSVSGAASQLSLTQPAISIALSNFETELGFRLFERSRGFFAPTAEAILLHAETEQGLLAIARVERCAADILEGNSGTITIATNGVLAFNMLPALISDFHRDHPHIRIDLRIHSSRRIAQLVSGRQIDIGLIDIPVPVAGLDLEVFKLPCVCIMLTSDELAKSKLITPAMLADRTVIGITGEHEVDRNLDRLLAEAKVTARRNLTTYYFAIMRNLVREGAGVALVDPFNGEIELNDGVCWRPFKPVVNFELGLITAVDQPKRKPADLFLDKLRALLCVRSS